MPRGTRSRRGRRAEHRPVSGEHAVAVFAPNPVLTVTLEARGREAREHSLPRRRSGRVGGEHGPRDGRDAGAVRIDRRRARRAAAWAGAERGRGPTCHLVETAAASGCYVTDRRSAAASCVSMTVSDPPGRHELDELVSLTCAEAIACGWLAMTNPLPGQSLPLEVYGDLVADTRADGVRTLVDLSSPRLDSALRGKPDLVKLNDWELAAFVHGPVTSNRRSCSRREARARSGRAQRDRDARRAAGDSAAREQAWQIDRRPASKGFREGCGDAMLGACSPRWRRDEISSARCPGGAAGAANFLRRGSDTLARGVEQLATGSARGVGGRGRAAWPQRAARSATARAPRHRLAAHDGAGVFSAIRSTRSAPHTSRSRSNAPRSARAGPRARSARRSRATCTRPSRAVARRTKRCPRPRSHELGGPLDQQAQLGERAQALLEVAARMTLGVGEHDTRAARSRDARRAPRARRRAPRSGLDRIQPPPPSESLPRADPRSRPSAAGCATSPPVTTRTFSAWRSSSACSAAMRSADLLDRARVVVADVGRRAHQPMPSRSRLRAIATLSARSSAPSSRSGRM